MSNKPGRAAPDPYSLPKSFGYAASGILHALLHERNLRIDFAAAAYIWYFSRYYDLGRTECALLVLMMGFVIACELINTAIENTVDLETPVYRSLAKIAKDVAAGAVLVSAFACVAAGWFLFWDMPTFARIGEDLRQNAFAAVLCALLTLFWVWLPMKAPKNHPEYPRGKRG